MKVQRIKGEADELFLLATEDGKFKFELLAMTEPTYLPARHYFDVEDGKKYGHEAQVYFDRKDGGRDEYVTYLPYEYTDVHTEADIRDTVRNIRRFVVSLSRTAENSRLLAKYRIHVELDNGDRTECRVEAYSRGQALSRLTRDKKYLEFTQGKNVRSVTIEREERKKDSPCYLFAKHGNTYICHRGFPRMTCLVTFDQDSDLKVLKIDPRDKATATEMDYATAMRTMGDFLIANGKKQKGGENETEEEA